MTKATPTLDLLETIQGYETADAGVEMTSTSHTDGHRTLASIQGAEARPTQDILKKEIMSYSDEERSRRSAEIESEVALERQQNATSGHSPPKVSRIEQVAETKEYALDRTLAETFPCSDPLSSIPDPASHLF